MPSFLRMLQPATGQRPQGGRRAKRPAPRGAICIEFALAQGSRSLLRADPAAESGARDYPVLANGGSGQAIPRTEWARPVARQATHGGRINFKVETIRGQAAPELAGLGIHMAIIMADAKALATVET
jgi:hypothetical protein